MSLLSEAMESCTMYDRSTTSDGYGGFISQWTKGATFDAAVVLDDSVQAQTAMSQGVAGVYTVTTTKSVNLQYHDVFERDSDHKVFRVMTDGDDKKTPASAALNMRNVRAEEWSLVGSVVENE